MERIIICGECGCYIDLELGKNDLVPFNPDTYKGREGTYDDPRISGELYEDLCDVCSKRDDLGY